MNSLLVTTQAFSLRVFPHSSTAKSFNLFLKPRKPTFHKFLFISSKFKPPKIIASVSSVPSSNSNGSNPSDEANLQQNDIFHSEVRSPQVPSLAFPVAKFSLSDKAYFLLAFIAFTTSVAFTSLVFAAVPTLFAMRKATISFSKLADTAREELPSTMAAVRLSGMEISDLTLELSDLSQEIADGVSKSAQALQAAQAGIQQIGSVAQQQTISMIEERANLPPISLKPVVAGAARKTSRAVGRATKSLMNMISGRESREESDDDITYI